MPGRARKATFTLHEEVLAAVDEAVTRGAASSKNAFVERALLRELKELRRRARRARWEEAAKDPLFRRDIEDVEKGFSSADAESARGIS
ncbi:MAG: hypothetical protein M1358_14565 [Chloroflexi bacterium]|nr:hypothetical protein [Chloroflexota bacterium]